MFSALLHVGKCENDLVPHKRVVDPGISFPLREAELPRESKGKTEVARNTLLSMFCCHLY
jgi:hypothetical protein